MQIELNAKEIEEAIRMYVDNMLAVRHPDIDLEKAVFFSVNDKEDDEAIPIRLVRISCIVVNNQVVE